MVPSLPADDAHSGADTRADGGGEVKIYQLDIDKNQEVADDEGVESTPTFMLYRDNELVWKQAGEVEGEVLLGRIQEALR